MVLSPETSGSDLKPIPDLQVRLFGPLSVLVEGAPLPPLRTRKATWLLALLVLKHQHPVDRNWLAGALWPDSDHDASLKNLRNHLAELRHALGSQAHRLHAPTPATLALDLGGTDVDLPTFDADVKRGDLASLTEAVRLYTGPLLEGCEEEWVVLEREQRQQSFLDALEALAAADLERGQAGQAVQRLRRCVSLDALRETAQCALLGSLAACGDYAGATEAYRVFRLLLHEELHTQPAAATTALYQQIRVRARQTAAHSAAASLLPLHYNRRDDAPADKPSELPHLKELDRPESTDALHDPAPQFIPVGASDLESLLQRSRLAALPVGTVTFLFTDIEGSTRLWDANAEAMRPALARHDALLRGIMARHEGIIFKMMGDACCAAFHTAPDALAAALAAQQAVCSEPWPEPITLKVRMALHTGEAEVRDNDYFGPALNRVARLLSVGHGGQVLVSEAAQNLCRDRLPHEASLQNLGTHRLRDLHRPETIFQLQHPALAAEFPALKTLDHPDLPNNLPQHAGSFIGREKEIAEVRMLLEQTRLLTLIGSGGCGKTRLSLQVAAEVLDEYSEGVWLVELATLSDPALVTQTMAQALGIAEQAGTSMLQTLVSALKQRRILLLLDNCEHLLAACAELASALLRSCPGVKVLATSRERLSLTGEQTYRIPPLGLPDPSQFFTLEALSQYEAVRLFIERALLVKSDFMLTNTNAPAVASICHRLDGIPLAIELAAARVRLLAVENINTRLDNRFRLLIGGDRMALPRQQTLRALMDWSYDLLNEQEKVLLQRLSVFAGGWTLEAAEEVTGKRDEGRGKSQELESLPSSLFPLPSDDVLDLLGSLVDKSLVIAEEQEDTVRYRMLETVRQYARDRLAESGDSDAVRGRHRDWFLVFAEEAEPKLMGVEQREWFQRLEAEHENLRSALDWSLVQVEGGVSLRFCGALDRFWFRRGHLTEGRAWCEQALGTEGGQTRTKERAKTLNSAGRLACYQGDYALARDFHEASLAIHREIGDRTGIAYSLTGLGNVARDQGDYTSARAYREESLAICREIGDRSGIAISLNNLGTLANSLGEYASARAYYEESLAILREIGDRSGIGQSLSNLGTIASAQGDAASARAYNEEGLAIQREIGDRRGIAYSLINLGITADHQGDATSARTCYEECLAIFRDIGDRRGIAYSLINLGIVADQQGGAASARTYYSESLTIFREIGDRLGIAYSLEADAEIAAKSGKTEQAVALWGVAEALREEIRSPLCSHERERYDREVAAASQALGDEAFTIAWAKGRAMALEEAIALALEGSAS